MYDKDRHHDMVLFLNSVDSMEYPITLSFVLEAKIAKESWLKKKKKFALSHGNTLIRTVVHLLGMCRPTYRTVV